MLESCGLSSGLSRDQCLLLRDSSKKTFGMQTRSVNIQDNWQVVPLYKKSWRKDKSLLRRRSTLGCQNSTQGKQQKFWILIHSFEFFECTCSRKPSFIFPLGFLVFLLKFFPKCGKFGVPPMKDLHC